MRDSAKAASRFSILISWAVLAAPAVAQDRNVVIRGAEAIGDSVVPFIFRGDLRDLPEPPMSQPGGEIVRPRRWSGGAPTFYTPEHLDPLLAVQAGVFVRGTATTTQVFAFEGADFGAQPPDPSLDVGENHVIQMVNASLFSIYDKATGSLVAGPTALDSLGSNACADGGGDPIVLYDQLADRWMMTELSATNGICVYISMTDDPVAGGWCQYEFATDTDSVKYSVWPDAYYVTANEGASPPVYALDRANILSCGTARPIQKLTVPGLPGLGLQALTPADLDGHVAPPVGAPGLMMRHRDTELGNQGPANPTQDILELWALDVDWDTPANTTLSQLPDILTTEFDSNLCPPISFFSCIPQPGTGTALDPVLEVIMNRLVYRNFGSHETLLGVLQTDVGDVPDHAGERWFELRKVGGGAWALFQEGTYSPDSDHRFIGSIAMDAVGDILLAYALSSATTSPSIAFTGRLATDPLGTMTEPEQVLIAGSGNNGTLRYGDYSQMAVDPVDGCTFWMTAEYTEGTSDNTTGIGAVQFDRCVNPPIFVDGFETGDVSAWSNAVP